MISLVCRQVPSSPYCRNCCLSYCIQTHGSVSRPSGLWFECPTWASRISCPKLKSSALWERIWSHTWVTRQMLFTLLWEKNQSITRRTTSKDWWPCLDRHCQETPLKAMWEQEIWHLRIKRIWSKSSLIEPLLICSLDSLKPRKVNTKITSSYKISKCKQVKICRFSRIKIVKTSNNMTLTA